MVNISGKKLRKGATLADVAMALMIIAAVAGGVAYSISSWRENQEKNNFATDLQKLTSYNTTTITSGIQINGNQDFINSLYQISDRTGDRARVGPYRVTATSVDYGTADARMKYNFGTEFPSSDIRFYCRTIFEATWGNKFKVEASDDGAITPIANVNACDTLNQIQSFNVYSWY